MTKVISRGFYRPHKRVLFTGELLNHKTGEVYIPPSRTKQEFKAECDINNVMKQYKRTGQFNHLSARAAQGRYTDLPEPVEFQDSMNLIIEAQQAFASLTSKVRERFNNDPARFLEFMADPENKDEAVKLGLVKAPPVEPKADNSGDGNRQPPSPPAPPAPPSSPPQPENGGAGGLPRA